jgi:outer membrane receptor protein involved in Fe transport
LVFLNGVRLGGVGGVLEQLRTIPATDVESVTVLMGPAAAFLHAMASDGAILVETK